MEKAAMFVVCLGIHFRYDSEKEYRLGKQIGEYAFKIFFNAVGEQ